MALAVIATALTACDTDDGRRLEPPDSYAVYQLENTTPSTTTTVAPPPTEFVAPTTSTTTPVTAPATAPDSLAGTLVDATGSQPAPGESPAGESTVESADGSTASDVSTSVSVQPSSSAAPTTTQFPDLSAEGLQFTGPWEPGAPIDAAYTCDGEEQAPLITWTAPPEGTVEIALSVIDEDFDGAVHWLVVGLPPEAGSAGGAEPLVVGSQATNDFDVAGWTGPCPPPGEGPHTYRFTLHALDQAVEVPPAAPAADLLAAVAASTFGAATFIGTYERAG